MSEKKNKRKRDYLREDTTEVNENTLNGQYLLKATLDFHPQIDMPLPTKRRRNRSCPHLFNEEYRDFNELRGSCRDSTGTNHNEFKNDAMTAAGRCDNSKVFDTLKCGPKNRCGSEREGRKRIRDLPPSNPLNARNSLIQQVENINISDVFSDIEEVANIEMILEDRVSDFEEQDYPQYEGCVKCDKWLEDLGIAQNVRLRSKTDFRLPPV